MSSRSNAWTDPLVRRLMRKHGGGDPEVIVGNYTTKLLESSHHTRLPVSVENIASFLGIRVNTASHPFAGRIYAEPNGQLVMDLSQSDHPNRRRFTCSHEIIHTAFPGFEEGRHRLDERVGHYERNRSEEEYLCDLGAAELLMPAAFLENDYAPCNGLAAVESLAQGAKVSLEAAGNRIVSLSPEPVVFLVLEVGHKPADRPALRRGERVRPQLRVRYARSSQLDAFIPRFKSADARSPFASALRSRDREFGIGSLPGSPKQGKFEIEAGYFQRGSVDRVLAIARPADR